MAVKILYGVSVNVKMLQFSKLFIIYLDKYIEIY